MPDSPERTIIAATRECRIAQKAYFKLRRYRRGLGGSKITGQMVKDALHLACDSERALDRLLKQYDERGKEECKDAGTE